MAYPYAGTKRKSTFANPPTKRRRYSRYRGTRSTTRAYTRRVPVKAKTATRINKSRISSLESKINGHVQRGYHNCKITNNISDPNAFLWSPQKAILFALNDFYTQTTAPGGGPGQIHFPLYSGTSPNITMTNATLTRWVDYLPGQALGFAPEYNQWKDQQLSQPSKVGYQPLYTELRICVNRRKATPEQGDMWVRVDMFSPRKIYLPTIGGSDPKTYQMPTAVGALSNMAVSADMNKNSFNPALWATKTRWIKLRAVEVDSDNIMNCFKLKCSFPKKFLRINMDVNSSNVGEAFYQSMDPRDIKWCLLSLSSFSVNQSTNPTPTITMTRKVVYRDSRGAQM